MFDWENADHTASNEIGLPKLDMLTTGLVAGTKVATGSGWAPIETIREGMRVLTFDGGLQVVVGITRNVLMADDHDIDSWPLHVPARALGNRDNMTVLPHQSVMIESDLAEEMTGDPFALIPAMALVGFRGIDHMRPSGWVEVIQLHFDRDEIVFANIGALFLARARGDLLSNSAAEAYTVLPLDLSDTLVDGLMALDLNSGAPRAAKSIAA